jgi:hypothetical protein
MLGKTARETSWQNLQDTMFDKNRDRAWSVLGYIYATTKLSKFYRIPSINLILKPPAV